MKNLLKIFCQKCNDILKKKNISNIFGRNIFGRKKSFYNFRLRWKIFLKFSAKYGINFWEKKILLIFSAGKKIFLKFSARKKNFPNIFCPKIRKKFFINIFCQKWNKNLRKFKIFIIFSAKKIFQKFSAKKKNLLNIFCKNIRKKNLS